MRELLFGAAIRAEVLLPAGMGVKENRKAPVVGAF
jgi:hypothetical protein